MYEDIRNLYVDYSPEALQQFIIDGEELSKAKELPDDQLDKIVHDINSNQS